MKVLMSGEDKAVGYIIQENRIRVSRGQVKFSPVDGAEIKLDDEESAKEAAEKDAEIKRLQDEIEALKAAAIKVEDSKDNTPADEKNTEGKTDVKENPPADDKNNTPDTSGKNKK